VKQTDLTGVTPTPDDFCELSVLFKGGTDLFVLDVLHFLKKSERKYLKNFTFTLTAVGGSAHIISRGLKLKKAARCYKLQKNKLFHGKHLQSLCLSLCVPPKTMFFFVPVSCLRTGQSLKNVG
jgi:hypothetical protein